MLAIYVRPGKLLNKFTQSAPRMSFFKSIGQNFLGTGLEKPEYELVQKTDGIEERHYKPAKWMSTKVQSMVYKEATSTGFWRLFKYIGGENEKGVKVEMTAPVATRIVPGAGPNCENTFTVSFYVPSIHQEDPPKPKNPEVFVEEFPEMTVYTRSFGGFADGDTYLNEAKDLSSKLKDRKVHEEFYFTAGYDSPFKLFNRTNEVWFVKQ